MTLMEYYKREVYSQGYADGQASRNGGVGTTYYEDEMDICICQEYYSSYVRNENDWGEDEIKFLELLGLSPEDFEDREDE